jgi:hypothetical protein
MRLPVKVHENRVEFLRGLFAFNPKLSVRKTQEILVQNFGRTMRADLMQSIRRQTVEKGVQP